jgi:transcriptional regulator with XRE-family HTH domain
MRRFYRVEERRRRRFGEWLREYREKWRLTAAEVAKEVGVSRQYLSAIENGHRLPSRHAAILLGRVFWLDGDVIVAAAGYLPLDLSEFLQERPEAIKEIREVCSRIRREEARQSLWSSQSTGKESGATARCGSSTSARSAGVSASACRGDRVRGVGSDRVH